jgi:hypothetical protein
MKKAKKRSAKRALLKPRNPVARSPLLAKGGPHGKSTAAKRRQAQVAMLKQTREPDLEA